MKSALANFQTLPLKDAARQLLFKLGYKSDKFLVDAGSKPQDFLGDFDSGHAFDQAKALFSEWKSADLLFQLTDAELSRTASLFNETDVRQSFLQSYVFIAIELKGTDYARGKFSAIARQINRLFPMPVMVVFKHGDRLTIAVINRRRNKIDESKDVLEKATLIRDITIAQPHRGHLDILASLALPNLVHPQKKPITDFDTLHAAWEQIFNVELLNERFYRELANWYFWALPQVEFPADLEPDDEKRRATGLIRLLTRLIFCWFLKEKNLIPEKLFHPADLAKLLKGFDPESNTSSTYYQAILQNLFFATLNQRMGKDGNGKPYRVFAMDEGFAKNRATYDVNNLYRYEALFRDEPDAALAHFADIPFLNGGLFECLDRTEDGTEKKRYLDGFSRNAKKRPHVPDRLFFDSGEVADLSEVYDDKKRKAEKVTGLITILNRYKFTIVENTPIDQEIALDPELLGKVFENLLASYNEETKTTARKQTGSFYTPRPIVDYMVDESLKAHLTRALVEKARMKEPDARAGLDLLFAYTEKEHAFTPAEVATLIAAIDALKILDPACGSGAFPMGVLHKLVYILGKLDPDNDRWKQTQLAKLDSAPMREELERAFADNNDDYGRKLYLIENCLYGVDIQAIAIQITKLRFFISLVCDQKTNRNKKDNHGIRPLPNLETKFVAANTLIGIPKKVVKEGHFDLTTDAIQHLQKQLQNVRHQYFTVQFRRDKLKLQREDKELRKKLAHELARSYAEKSDADTVEKLALWDPFDPQCTAGFFDAEWMFGPLLANGFNVVIGNPPYVLIPKDVFEDQYGPGFPLLSGKPDLYRMFVERSLRLLCENGILSLIIPNTILAIPSAQRLREFLTKYVSIQLIVDLTSPVFGAAAVNNIILQFAMGRYRSQMVRVAIAGGEDALEKLGDSICVEQASWLNNPKSEWTIHVSGAAETIIEKIQGGASFLGQSKAEMCLGMQVYHNTIHSASQIDKRYLHADSKKGSSWIPEFSGRHVEAFGVRTDKNVPFVDYSAVAIYQKPDRKYFTGPRVILREIVGDRLVAGFTDEPFAVNKSCYILRSDSFNGNELKALLAILTSKCVAFWVRLKGDKSKQALFPRITMNALKGIPLPANWQKQSSTLSKLIDSVLSDSERNSRVNISALEREIDQQVYALYGLTPEEIAIVESAAR